MQPYSVQIKTSSLVINAVVIGALLGICNALGSAYVNAKWGGIILFLVCLLVMLIFSLVIFRYFIRGAKSSRKGKYIEAINSYKKGYYYFTKHRMLNKLKYLTIIALEETYAELALCNIAHTYSLAGDLEKAREYYEQALQEFPKSRSATASLKYMDENKKQSKNT